MASLRNVLWTKSLKDIFEYSKQRSFDKKRFKERERIIQDYFREHPVRKLQLGCGPNPIKGWLNTDLRNTSEIAYLDAAGKYPFSDNSFDYIFSEHIFEHLTIVQETNMLAECYRVLKPGGKFRLAVPKIDFLLKLCPPHDEVEKEYVRWAVDTIPSLRDVKKMIGNEDHLYIYVINNFFKDWGHQVIHNAQSLSVLLTRAGFNKISVQQVGSSEDPALRDLEHHGKVIPAKFNELETIIVEASK